MVRLLMAWVRAEYTGWRSPNSSVRLGNESFGSLDSSSNTSTYIRVGLDVANDFPGFAFFFITF